MVSSDVWVQAFYIVITVTINFFISIFGGILCTLISAFDFGPWDICQIIPSFMQLIQFVT